MVYCGKPSKGCAPCRARRSKCDQTKPSCSQCVRANRTCSGYRDEQSLMFRDQSDAVVIKARKKNPRLSIDLTFTVPMDDQATCFFFHNYFAESRIKIHEYLPTIFRVSELGTALSTVISSVGMAGISNIRKAPEIRAISRQRYSTALRLTNSALVDPVEAVKDQTLLAVILLGLYESITCDTPQSMVSWTNHVKGAIALLQLRSEERLRDPVGLGMFLHIRHDIVVSCLQRRVSCPRIILKWSRIIRDYYTEDERVVSDFFELAARLCALRSLTRVHGWEDPALIINTALSIDSDYDVWVASLPPRYILNSKLEFSRQDVRMVGVLNNYRAHRLLLNEIILRCATTSELPTEEPTIFQFSKTMIEALAAEICSSSPFSAVNGKSSTTKLESLRSGDGTILMWPLYIVAVINHSPSDLREWAILQLACLGDKMGIHQATTLANVLNQKREITIWEKLVLEEVEEEIDW